MCQRPIFLPATDLGTLIYHLSPKMVDTYIKKMCLSGSAPECWAWLHTYIAYIGWLHPWPHIGAAAAPTVSTTVPASTLHFSMHRVVM